MGWTNRKFKKIITWLQGFGRKEKVEPREVVNPLVSSYDALHGVEDLFKLSLQGTAITLWMGDKRKAEKALVAGLLHNEDFYLIFRKIMIEVLENKNDQHLINEIIEEAKLDALLDEIRNP